MKRILAAILVIGALLAGCSAAKPEPSASQTKPLAEAKAKPMVEITVGDLLKRLQSGEKPLIIDVREQHEWDAGHIDGARLMPLATVEKQAAAAGIAKGQEIILICRSGNRSAQAYEILQAQGYTNLKNVSGGMNDWAKIGPVTK